MGEELVRIDRVVWVAVVSVGLAAGSWRGAAQSASKADSAVSTRSNLDMTVVKPETVGFSSEGLERLHTLMEEAVKDQRWREW